MSSFVQDLTGKLKIVKVEADPNPGLVEKYKVCSQEQTHVYMLLAMHISITAQMCIKLWFPSTIMSGTAECYMWHCTCLLLRTDMYVTYN